MVGSGMGFHLKDFIKEYKSIRKQNRAFRVIYEYIKSNESFSLNEEKRKDVVWQFWEPPLNGTTIGMNLVSCCLNSMERHIWDGYTRVLLNLNNSKEYIVFPDFVYEKLNRGGLRGFTITAFSDILRLGLLCQYGGIWADATMYALRPLGKMYLLNDNYAGFSFQRSMSDSRQIKNEWRNYNPGYFSWSCFSRVKWLNSFIVSGYDRSLLNEILRVLLLIWKYEDVYPHYFASQMICDFLVRKLGFSDFSSMSDVPVHYLQRYANDEFNNRFYQMVREKYPLQKMTWKLKGELNRNTYLYNMLHDQM